MAKSTSPRPWHKDETIAILLAAFFGPWTWLYTFKKDSIKYFAAMIPSGMLGLTLFIAFVDAYRKRGAFIIVGEELWGVVLSILFLGPIIIGFWVWAIIDVTMEKPDWYKN